MSEKRQAIQVLTLNTLAFTVCFAVWMMNGVLITFLVGNRVYDFDKAEMGWLIISIVCLVWMHFVVRRMMAEKAPHLAEQIESPI